LLFFIAAILLALAASGWWLQRIAFDTSVSGELAEVVLEQPEIRDEIAELTAEAAADALDAPISQVRATVDQVASTSAGAALMQDLVAESHARLIGVREEPVEITSGELVQIVRDERASDLPPVVIPVEEVKALSVTREALGWAVPILAIVGGVAFLLGLLAHPRRADAVFGIGAFCIFAAIFAVLLGWLLPVHGTPEIDDSPWLLVIPAVADHNLPFVIVAAGALFIGGLSLMVISGMVRRRRTWSSPVSARGYGDQHRWS
jgi:hypothetical protein